MSSHAESDRRAFVLGLDGIPWNLVEKWAGEGELPSFQRVLSEGAGGPLTSTTPPSTSLAWPSIATGAWPDGHGVYGFQALSPTYSHRINTSRDVRQPELWDLVSPSVVGNVPMTYPADDTDATMVTGMMTPERDEGFTNPPELAEEIEDRIPDYTIGLDWEQYHGRVDAFMDDLGELVAARRKLMDLLHERGDWRLFFFVYTAPDRLQHLVWDEDVLLEHYRTLDSILGDAMDVAEREDATLYVVSDHGFGPVEKLVYVNRLLERGGYLVRRDDAGARGLLGRFGIDKDRVLGLLERVGVDDRTLVDHLPRSVLDAAAARVPGDHGLYDLDYDRTVAFAHGPGNVYVNDTGRFADGAVHPAEVDRVTDELVEVLESAVDPETGERVLRVWNGDDHYPGDDYAPDLIVRGRSGYAKRTSLGEQSFADSKAMAGHHEREGVFVAWGPDVAAGTAPEDATVVDVAPTVLHGLGEAIPARADGRVLAEIFTSGSEPDRREPTTAEYATTAGDDAVDRDFSDVEDRLRGLGYME
jgi:predicted AlkP superfamily phosphohydrolase/phosphomutase